MYKNSSIINQVRNYGLYYTMLRKLRVLGRKMSFRYQECVVDILSHKYLDQIYDPVQNENNKTDSNTNYIWSMWWQGYNQAPELVKKCLDSIKNNSTGNYKFILITKENYEEYINLSSTIQEKIEKGIFSFTFLSDLIRSILLSQYGGWWIDATVFVSSEIPVFEKDVYFYSPKIIRDSKTYKQIFHGKWAISCMYASSASKTAEYLHRCLVKYWINEMEWIDYFTTDSFLEMLYRNDMSVKSEIDNSPRFEGDYYCLSNHMNDIFQDALYKEYINGVFHKLNWKKNYYKDIDGSETNYSYWIRENIE